MKKLLFVVLIISTLGVAACGSKPTVTPSTFQSPLGTPGAGLPNPASKNCADQGYRLEIRTAADGSQTGYCIFPDGTECEEWAFFRNECNPGTPKP
jgi:putative hemolysin